jgi:hypothetical protein
MKNDMEITFQRQEKKLAAGGQIHSTILKTGKKEQANVLLFLFAA